MEFDLFADCRFIFANRLCNSCFSGTVDNAGKDNTSFIQSQMRKSIRNNHMLPAFPAAVGYLKCMTKAVFMEVEINFSLRRKLISVKVAVK